MRKNIQRIAVGLSLLALALAMTTIPAHAQNNVTPRPDKSAYAPGDSGTLTVNIVNTSGGPQAVRNITVYWPWAEYDTNGKWLANANFTNNFSPPQVLAATGANNFSYTTPTFNIPSWWGFSSTQQFGCPATTNERFGTYSGCILLGTNSTNRYDGTHFGVSMAIAVYNPSSLSLLSEWVPVASLIVLVIATAVLFLVWDGIRKIPKK